MPGYYILFIATFSNEDESQIVLVLYFEFMGTDLGEHGDVRHPQMHRKYSDTPLQKGHRFL